MKIISKFRDYYDTIISFGIDPEIKYFRNTLEITLKKYQSNLEFNYSDDGYDLFKWRDRFSTRLDPILIYFCGTTFLAFRATYSGSIGLGYFGKSGKSIDSAVCYDSGDIIKFIEGYYQKVGLESVFVKSPKWKTKLMDYKEYSEFFFDKVKDIKFKSVDEYYIKYSSPIILEDSNNKLIVNPCLKDIGFQKIKDPFTTFQEVSMFISNTFGMPGNKIIEVSNQTKIKKHGFDKWSFRKMKE